MSNGAKYSSFHILGASLGAHVAGYVGHFCQGRLGRITGLDPSGPLFHSVHESEKLSKHDALFVGKKFFFSCLDHTFPVHLFYQLYMQETRNLNITGLVQ